MKKLLSTLLLFASICAFGQTVPQGINYQAVAIDESGKPIPGVDIVGSPIDDAEIGIRISILENSPTGAVLYQEEHEVLTDQYGMFNLVIGQGLQVSPGPFSSIDWIGDKYLQVELSVDNNGDFKISAVQQLMSVPYAFLANRALNVDDADADASNEIQNLSISGDSLSISVGNTVLLPTSNDLDKDPTNELQQLFVQNDSLFLTADTSGIGYALNPNNRREEIIDFNKTNCFPIPRVDSLLYPLTGVGAGNKVFIEKRNANLLISHGNKTIILDTTGNRIAEYSLGLRWGFANTYNLGYNQNMIPLFNNRMTDASNLPFCGLRTYNLNGDTIGTNIILDSNYLLLIDYTGNYITHLGLDSLVNIGVTDFKLQALDATSLYFSYRLSNNYFIAEFNLATTTVSYPSHIQNSFPLFTANNEYWVNTSVNSDSCLIISKEVNGILSPVYNTDTAVINYYYYLINTNYYTSEFVITYPTKNKSGILRFRDPTYYSSIVSNGPALSYIDSTFHITESPVFVDYAGSSYYLGNTYFYCIDSIHHFTHSVPYGTGGSVHASIQYHNKYFVASQDMKNRLQFSFNFYTKKISNLLIEPLNDHSLDKLYAFSTGYSKIIVFQDFGDIVVGLEPSNSSCYHFNGNDDVYLYFMKKDDFESYFIH